MLTYGDSRAANSEQLPRHHKARSFPGHFRKNVFIAKRSLEYADNKEKTQKKQFNRSPNEPPSKPERTPIEA